MKIEDKRSTTSWVPAVEILNEVVPLFRKQHFVGIRKVVLLDQDYHKGPEGLARYCAIDGTKQADVEMYFEWYDDLPEEVKSSKLYLTYMIVHTLMHEVYHHMVRGQHRIRQPKFRKEQAKADQWGEGAVHHVFEKLFPREEFEPEWIRLQKILKETREKSNKMPGHVP